VVDMSKSGAWGDPGKVDTNCPLSLKKIWTLCCRVSSDVSCDQIGILVDSEHDLSTRNGKTRVFINKTLSKETVYQQDVINRNRLSTRLIVGKLVTKTRYEVTVLQV
jgi:hypothetical protein